MKTKTLVLLLWIVALTNDVTAGSIANFPQAYDRLIADAYNGDPESVTIYGKPSQIDGPIMIDTAKGSIEVGSGPGWVFYRVDKSRKRPFYYFHVVTTVGEVSRKLVKSKPLNVGDYEEVDAPVVKSRGGSRDIQTLDEAYAELLQSYLGHVVIGRDVYGFPEKIKGQIEIRSWGNVITFPEGIGWLFFIDDYPDANWEHGCRYVFLSDTSDIEVKRASTPPDDFDDYREMTRKVDPSAPVKKSSLDQSTKSDLDRIPIIIPIKPPVTTSDNRWAVIISGGANKNSNRTRYWKDCSYFYKRLMAAGFRDDQIYVLCSDGTDTADDQDNDTSSPLDLDGDGDDDIQYSAKKTNVTNVLGQLERTLTSKDLLYVFTTDHGGSRDGSGSYSNPSSKLNLWHETLADTNLSAWLNRVETKATVCMFEQCFSGGMLDDLEGPNRVLMSAARYWELSWSGGGDAAGYDEWSYYITKALGDPDEADESNDDRVSMEEAYLYALAKDARRSEAIQSDGDNDGEHPSYYSNPWDLGRRVSLNGLIEPIHDPLKGGYRQREISESYPTGGTDMNWDDDDEAWSYDMPFGFRFFGSTYNKIWVDSNGIINLGDATTPTYHPQASSPENRVDRLVLRCSIAPLWDDLSTDGTGLGIFISKSSSWVTIRWAAETVLDVNPRPVNFAVQLGKNGEIRFLYGPGNDHTSRIDGRDKTIGISNGDGKYHLCLRNGQGVLDSAPAIEFLPSKAVFVDPKWLMPGAGTKRLPFKSIQTGYAAAKRYDYLCLKGGTHALARDTLTLDRPMTVRNYEGTARVTVQ